MEQSIVISNLSNYSKFYQIIESKVINQKFNIIFEKSNLEPFEVLILTQFAIIQKQRNCNITVTTSNQELITYLKEIEIADFCNKNVDFPTTVEAITKTTAMPIRRLNRETMDNYIIKTQQYFNQFCEDKDLTSINTGISELINNVIDHSKSPIDAYIFCQFYESNKILKIAVADLGVGIPKNVNEYIQNNNGNILNETNALFWALTIQNTTKSTPNNRGRGLDTINSFMKSYLSDWHIFTNGIQFLAKNDIKHPFDKYQISDYIRKKQLFNERDIIIPNVISSFFGTIIQLDIQIENLENEEIVDFGW